MAVTAGSRNFQGVRGGLGHWGYTCLVSLVAASRNLRSLPVS